MKQITKNGLLNDQLGNIWNHASLVGAGLRSEDAFNITHNNHLSVCCAMPLEREGSNRFCCYCLEPHNEQL